MPPHRVPTGRSFSKSSKRSKGSSTAPPDLQAEAKPRLLRVGKIVGVHALAGEVRVLPDNPDSEAFAPGRTLFLRRGPERRLAEVASVRPHKCFFLVRFAGVENRSAAEAYRGYEVYVRTDELPRTRPNEYYYHELVGMEVLATTGEFLGQVASVMPTAGADLLVIRHGEHEYFIPMVAEFVRSIDRQARRIRIELQPGLLDQ
jgi:16S rRNA processing protein RimM